MSVLAVVLYSVLVSATFAWMLRAHCIDLRDDLPCLICGNSPSHFHPWWSFAISVLSPLVLAILLIPRGRR